MKKQEVIDTLSVIQKTHFQEATKQIDKEGYPGNRRAYLYNAIDPNTDELYPPPYLIELAFKNATGNELPKRFFAGIGKSTGHFDQLQSCGFLVESKIDPKRIDKAMTILFNRASLFAQLIEDPESIFKNTKQEHDLIKEAMREENDRWAPKPNHFQPVVLFRHMLFQNIKDGKSIDSDLIESIKNEILTKNISAKYNLSQKFRDLINNYPEKDYFKAWKNPFSLVFPFFYSKKFKQYTQEQLNNVDNFLRDRLDLKDVKSNIVGFEGARNMGADHAWLALYPSHAPSVQDAYQLFVGINKEGYTASLYKGHKVIDDSFKEKKAQFKNIEECHEIMAGFVEEWKTLNNSLNKKKGVDRKYWLYAPGENANKWDEFRNEGIMALGWDELGDLNHYDGKKEIAERLRQLENTESSKKNDASANYDIFKTIEIGDVIIVKKGVKEYLGYGVVESEYFYDDDRKEFKSCRKVDWKSNGIWAETKGEIVAKTLTDITKYPDYVERLKALLGIDFDNTYNYNVWIEKSITKNRIDRQEGPLKLGSALWSPTKDKRGGDIYSEMRMVKPGDVVLHLTDNKGIQGVSIVKREHTVGKGAENTAWDTDAYIVELRDYIQLPELFDRSLFLNEKNRSALDQINDNHKVFYNKKLDLNQGAYLTESPPELTGILCRTYFESFQKQLPHLNNNYTTTTDKLEPMNNPINAILFGPPGTGKTYKLKTHYFPKYTSSNEEVSREVRIQEVLKNLTWWQVIAIVLLDLKEAKAKDIYNHELVKLKEKLTTSKNVDSTIRGKLQAHTVDSCDIVNTNRKLMPLIFYKEQGAIWRLDQEGFQEISEDLSELAELCKNEKSNETIRVKRYEFVTFHQSYAYEDFIEGIKPVMETEGDGELHYEIKDGLFKTLCQRAKNDPENKYAIFIDEINRGNVSSIFGELITLIEPDKRLGMENAMTATLPYSRDTFGVPSNVDIYGTMNTADRSVEALDTALRRRFSFKEMLPMVDELNDNMDGISLKDLLSLINERIEALVDRDHTIGHSYLINVKSMDDLNLAFKDKIIPLLQEYFYGDYGKIGLVLGEGFINITDAKENLFADFNYDGREGLAQNKFELKTFKDNEEFKAAIKTLLKK